MLLSQNKYIMNGQKEKLRTINTERKPLQGVINILDFNRHFYYIGFGLSIAWIIICLTPLFGLYANQLLIFGLILIFIGLLIPLFASAYVYDLANYYQLKWLEKSLPNLSNEKVANIHAGFDETSILIQKRFPKLDIIAYDFYNKEEHTEIAIKRARRKSLPIKNTRTISTHSIEENNQAFDHIFFLSALHEVRKREEKIIFLNECKRVLKDDGTILIVEHLRDVPNFLAFHIGFFHFFSKKEWMICFKHANLKVVEEKKHTPLLTIFKLEKQ